MSVTLPILVHTPAHSALAGALSYLSPVPLAAGSLVRVPLGRRDTLGVVWDGPAPAHEGLQLKPITGVLHDLPPLGTHWRALVAFAAQYYQRSAGEVALAALPPALRDLDNTQLLRRLKAAAKPDSQTPTRPGQANPQTNPQGDQQDDQQGKQPADPLPELSPEQAAALAAMRAHPGPYVLFGATGSGKTEVYMRRVAEVLAQDPQAQVLVMVPEINLTPQLEARFQDRFAPALGAAAVVSMHSGMTGPQRLKSWLGAHLGQARVVLGTRMAVFASLPQLRLIVVDEEHDPSYKQQEGARYSARDLAVYRGKREGVPVILGSATPSLESWHHSRADGGRYLRIAMPSRIKGPPSAAPTDTARQALASTGVGQEGAGAVAGASPAAHLPPTPTQTQAQTQPETGPAGREAPRRLPSGSGSALRHSGPAGDLPLVRRVDMNHQPKRAVLAPPLLDAIKTRLARGEQVMVLLNRRGYAPVLACTECDWKSECPYCSAYRVFHKIDRSLRCHHCGLAQPVPRACPGCGNPDIAPLGRGTERLEEHLAELLADVQCPLPEAALPPSPGESASAQGTAGPSPPRAHAASAPTQVQVHQAANAAQAVNTADTADTAKAAARPAGPTRAVRIARIDADSTRLKGELQTQLAQVHAGEVDVLVGTQMIAKGHDFRRISLVAAINPDGALFSSDFRAAERLFSLLMQSAGRAGRDASLRSQSEMWVQTFYPSHPLYAALKQHDYPAFAAAQLAEREQAGLPPFSFQALVRSDARSQEAAQGFLQAARTAGAELAAQHGVTLYPAVPLSIQRVANVERAQMLLESASRPALQRFLSAWQSSLHATRASPAGKGVLRWAIDVDPLLI